MVSHVWYKLGFYTPEDNILHSHRFENFKFFRILDQALRIWRFASPSRAITSDNTKSHTWSIDPHFKLELLYFAMKIRWEQWKCRRDIRYPGWNSNLVHPECKIEPVSWICSVMQKSWGKYLRLNTHFLSRFQRVLAEISWISSGNPSLIMVKQLFYSDYHYY
jgi:hypothetical protein